MRYGGLLIILALLAWPNSGDAQDSRLLVSPGTVPEVWGDLLVPDGPGPHPAVIVLHGSKGWRPGYVDIARRFTQAGFGALVLDYYAQVGGAENFSEESLQKWEAWRQAVINAASYLGSLPSVTGDRIALVGFSRGAFLAVSVAASIPSVVAVVDYHGGRGDGVHAPEVEVGGLPPVLIIHGEADTIVPVSFANELKAAVLDAGGEVEMHLFPGEEHGFNAFWADSYSEDAAEKTFELTIASSRLGSSDEASSIHLVEAGVPAGGQP